jgi:hypothetical protein
LACWAEERAGVEVINPVASDWLRRLLRMMKSRDRYTPVFVYPTVGGRCSIRSAVFLFAFLLHGERVAVHLHEFRRLHVVHQLYVWLMLVLARGPIIVSTVSEREGLREKPLLGRRKLYVCPAPVAVSLHRSTSSIQDARALPLQVDDTPPTIGVFGIPRKDKMLERLWDVVNGLDRPVNLELVGEGWEHRSVPDRVHANHHVKVWGFVEHDWLSEVLTRWSFAIAPFADGATDGRSSCRIPCFFGVPTLTIFPEDPEDLTFRPCLLLQTSVAMDLLVDPPIREERARLAAYTEAFERKLRQRIDDIICGQPSE